MQKEKRTQSIVCYTDVIGGGCLGCLLLLHAWVVLWLHSAVAFVAAVLSHTLIHKHQSRRSETVRIRRKNSFFGLELERKVATSTRFAVVSSRFLHFEHIPLSFVCSVWLSILLTPSLGLLFSCIVVADMHFFIVEKM